ncbi:MAG TPA: RodZ domain-containing protein [Ignavibacteriales bacterium]|nr:RodZ domain-containing protein [Ignavibacteriales bacterium]
MMRKLAEELKENRLKQEITLQQMFVKTRISIKYLEAIENGNFEVLPEVYLKAFIKSYAAAVGMDEEAVIRKFEAAKGGHEYQERQEEETHHAQREERPPQQPKRPKKEYHSIDTSAPLSEDDSLSQQSGRGNLIVAGIGILLFIVIVAAYFMFFHHSSKEIVTEKPYEEYIENNKPKTDSLAATAPTQTAPQSASNDSLTLKVKTKDLTWVKITADSTHVSEFNLQPNTEKDIKARRNFKVILGNSGAVELMLNNNPLSFSGGKGTVRVLRIDSSGVASSRAVKSSKDKNE